MGTTHTQGKVVQGGGGDGWDDVCRKALQACGIDPEGFGTYNQRKKAQGDERSEYRDRRATEAAAAAGNKQAKATCKKENWTPREHEAGCPTSGDEAKLCMCHESRAALEDLKPEKFLRANSQAAHVLANSFTQGRRGDPCTNVPPGIGADGKPHAGTYGTDDSTALCMDMLGDSRKVGTEHYSGTRVEDGLGAAFRTRAEFRMANGESRANANAVTAADQSMIVHDTMEVAGRGPPSNHLKEDPEAFERRALHREARAARAAELEQETAADGKGRGVRARGAAAGAAGKPKKSGPSADDVAMMQKCIEARFHQSVDEMRANCVSEFGPETTKGTPREEAKKRAAALARMNELEKRGAAGPTLSRESHEQDIAEQERDNAKKPKSKREPVTAEQREAAENAPTKDECREYQAHWLYLNGGSQDPPQFPPYQGKPPDTMPDPPPDVSPGRKSRRGNR